VSLSQLHGKRVAVVVDRPDERRILRATLHYQWTAETSGILRLELENVGEADGNPVLFIEDGKQDLALTPDTEFGCDYQLTIAIPAANAASP
jgi:hypothetical protein